MGFSLAFVLIREDAPERGNKRRAKVGPPPRKSVKSRACVFFVGRLGGACDACGTTRVTLCTACGTACDRWVLPALQCVDGWRMLGLKWPTGNPLWRGSLLPLGCEAVQKCLPVMIFGERFALEREQAPSPQGMCQPLKEGSAQPSGRIIRNARQPFESPCPASVDRDPG
ncbi:hypothetical protein ACVK1X_004429 [Pseudomonas sp. PvR086]|jgi:hypothetical protein|nr:hypothetical protein [Pseudomonas frederiksbergensis]